MLKKSASGVLTSLRGSTYRSVCLASSPAAALLNGPFEHPASAFSSCPKRIRYRSSDAEVRSARKILRVLFLAGLPLMGWLVIQFTDMSEMSAWAGSPPSAKSTKAAGEAERGRGVFNGKGVCYYCHGIDGKKDQRPQLAADTATLIAQLNPPPVDLRNPNVLRLKTDRQRVRAILDGHPGTGMFPDTTMTNQELIDTLAYLALLRSEGSSRKP